VDLERIRADRPFEALTRRRFTPGEHRVVCGAGAERARVFHRLWTAKEACLKATGDGLRSLSCVEVTLDPEDARARWNRARLGADVWRVQQLDVGGSWAGSLAAPGTDWKAELRRWRL
jgi:4'-phosphopantetheinyl transferase